MTAFHSLLFGIVEGLTEFIPVSSTAHMLLVQHLLGLPPSETMFAYLVLIQLGAIVALLVYFWIDFWTYFRALFARPFSSQANRFGWLIVIATVPALLGGALLRNATRALFGDPLMEAAIRFLVAALLLASAERLGSRSRQLDSLNVVDASVIGLFQFLAVFPGASRSGASIAGGMFRGLDRPGAARFAFLISAPVMVAAGLFELARALRGGQVDVLLPILPVGLLVSAVLGWISIRWLIHYVSGHRLYGFAGYCAVAGAACLVLRGL